MVRNRSYKVERVDLEDREKYSGKTDDYGNVIMEEVLELKLVSDAGDEIDITIGSYELEQLKMCMSNV